MADNFEASQALDNFKASQALLDTTFVEKHLREREARFPIESSFYDELARHNEKMRAEMHDGWRDCLDMPILESNRQFFNRAFQEVAAFIGAIMPDMQVADAAKRRAAAIYAVQLPPGATFRQLVHVDAFATQTHSLEIGKEVVSEDISKAETYAYYHPALHRAQQSEFLFLHEMFVGYLVNLRLNNDSVPDERGVRLRQQDPGVLTEHWELAAYVIHFIGRILHRDPKSLAGLHFADSAQIRAEVPATILDVMTLAAHAYWYLDYGNAAGNYGLSPSELLSLVMIYFVIPALEHIHREPTSRCRDDAGRTIDRLFLSLMSGREGREGEELTVMDVVRQLVHVVQTMWIQTTPTIETTPTARA